MQRIISQEQLFRWTQKYEGKELLYKIHVIFIENFFKKVNRHPCNVAIKVSKGKKRGMLYVFRVWESLALSQKLTLKKL